MKNKTKSTIFKNRTFRFPEIIVDAMKKHSVKIPGCPRPEDGSMNHFGIVAVLEKLERCGESFRYLYPEYYQ
jgi:hypothetical protein